MVLIIRGNMWKKLYDAAVNVQNTVATDYVGIVSGNKKPDKLKKTGWQSI